MASSLTDEEVSFALKRRTSSVNATLNSPLLLSSTKKLKRMPHLFARVLELPFHADTVVQIQESGHSFTFVVRQPGLIAEEVKAELVEIVPGATKVVIGGGQGLLSDLESSSQLELWRFRLPASTILEDAVARYENEVLQVTIPKNPVSCAEQISKKDNDAESKLSLEESESDTRQQCFIESLDECTENPVTALRDMNGFDSSSDEEDESTTTGHDTTLHTEELQFQQRDLLEDLESFGSPRHARERSSCTKAAGQQEGGEGESPHFLHNLGVWVHGFAIFV